MAGNWTRGFAAALVIGLAAAASTRAQSDDQQPKTSQARQDSQKASQDQESKTSQAEQKSGQDQSADSKGQPGEDQQARTIRGHVAGVTVAGETIYDAQAGRAIMVQASYLTIVGRPAGSHAGGQQAGGSEGEGRERDASARAEAKQQRKDERQQQRQARRQRADVYMIAITPRTEVCKASSDESVGKSQGDEGCEFDQLELGDRVEIEFKPAQGSMRRIAAQQRHGRHRMHRGEAATIRILPQERSDSGQGQSDSQSSESTEGESKSDDGGKESGKKAEESSKSN